MRIFSLRERTPAGHLVDKATCSVWIPPEAKLAFGSAGRLEVGARAAHHATHLLSGDADQFENAVLQLDTERNTPVDG